MFKIRDLFSSALTLAVLTPTCAVMAVGVGEIRLQSHLNEPLYAEIPLIDTKNLEPSDLQVKIAISDEFQKNNIEALPWLQQIKFEVVKKPDGKKVVQMTTAQPVKDPIVDLIVQLNWPDGQLVRDFTVLLDPPSKSSTALAKASNQKLTVAKTERAPNPVTMGDQYHSLQNQTLWRVAKKLVENSEFTVYQGVVAIVQKNPDVFKQGFHNIPKGASLMMPNQSELSQIDKDQAKTLFHQFNKGELSHLPQLTNQNKSVTTEAPEVEQASSDVSIAVPNGKPTKHLKIVGDSEVEVKTSTQQDLVMRDRLNQVEEAIDSLKRQNDEISQKNKILQTQNETLMQTLANKEAELNQLRSQPQEQPVNYGIPPKPQPPRAIKAVQLNTRDIDQTTVMDLTQPQEAKVSNNSRPISPRTPKSPQTVEFDEKSDDDTDIYYALFILVFSLSIAAWAWFSRNTIFRLIQSMFAFFSHPKATTTSQGISGSKSQYGIHFDFESSLEELMKKENVMKSVAINQKKQENLFKKDPGISVQDADVYIAYEHYDQAIKLLQSIILTEPSNSEAIIKLLEVFIQTKQYREFEKWQAKVPATLKESDPLLWSKYNALKKQVSDDQPMEVEVELQACPLPEVLENNPLENLEVKTPEVENIVVQDIKPEVKKVTNDEVKNVVKDVVSDEVNKNVKTNEPKTEELSINNEPIVFNKPLPKPVESETKLEKPKSELTSWGKLELVQEENYDAELNQAKSYIEAGDIEPGKAILQKLLVKAPQMKSDVEAILKGLEG